MNSASQVRRAFSLTDLLVVIAIVMLAIAFVLPLLGTRPPRNRDLIQCIGNLRQITMAWAMYSADNGDHLAPWSYQFVTSPPLPAMAPELPESFTRWSDYRLYWPELLAPYLSVPIDVQHPAPGSRTASFEQYRNSIIECPTRQNWPDPNIPHSFQTGYAGYGMPRYGIGGEAWREGYPGLHRMPQIGRPGNRLLFVETNSRIARWGPQGPEPANADTLSVYTDAQGHAQDYRHRGRMSTAWADGHVESIDYRELVAPYESDWFDQGPWRILPDAVTGNTPRE